jgi:hypothetical protein
MPEHHPNQKDRPMSAKRKKRIKEEESKTKNENKVFDEEKRLDDVEFWNMVDRDEKRQQDLL